MVTNKQVRNFVHCLLNHGALSDLTPGQHGRVTRGSGLMSGADIFTHLYASGLRWNTMESSLTYTWGVRF